MEHTRTMHAPRLLGFGLYFALIASGCGADPTAPGAHTAAGSAGIGSVGANTAGSAGADQAGSGGSASGSAGAGGATTGGSAGAAGAAIGTCEVPKTEKEQPTLLSQTGCVNMADPQAPAPDLVPYDVNSPLWSDGADKQRFVRIPDGLKIHVKDCSAEPDTCKPLADGGTAVDEGHWQFPIGTVLVKNFGLRDTLIETRLMMRIDELSWLGVSYEWNDTGTEATLLPDGKSKDVGEGQIWSFPSRSECFQCHTKGAGISLGPTTAQLNGDYDYADGTMNQVDKFVALGLIASQPKAIPAYPKPSADGDLEARARSYLQANCSICHRPGGTVGDVDLRFDTSFKETRLCGENIQRGTGDPNLPQKRLVPGHPEQSSLSFRVHDTGAYRMPKLGSSVVDPVGAKLLDDWISSLETCP